MTARMTDRSGRWTARINFAPFLDAILASLDELDAVLCIAGDCDGRTAWIDDQTAELLGIAAGVSLWDFLDAATLAVVTPLFDYRCDASPLPLTFVDSDRRLWPVTARLVFAGDRF